MAIKKKDVMKVVLANDTRRIGQILDRVGFLDGDSYPLLISESLELASFVLSLASAMSSMKDLTDELAEELITRTAATVDVFTFARVVTVGRHPVSQNLITEELCEALGSTVYDEKVAQIIDEMQYATFMSLLAFLISWEKYEKWEGINIKYHLPIIKKIYNYKLVPDDLFFAFMASCQRDSMESEIISGMPMPILQYCCSVEQYCQFMHIMKKMAEDTTSQSKAETKQPNNACEVDASSEGGGWIL